MKNLVLEKPGRFMAVDTDEPAAPGPGEVLVATHRMGVCGTDISGYLGKMPLFRYPRIPGHELGVEVLAVGQGVTSVSVGDRCSVEPYMNCGDCFACRTGHSNCCTKLNVIGVMVDGGLRERFIVRGDKLHRSEQLSYEQLALVETLAIGRHAVDRGGAQQGENVMVIGAGPIGLSVIEFAKLAGANITVLDLSEDRLAFCRSNYGITQTVAPTPDGGEIDTLRGFTDEDLYSLVIDATGSHHAMSAALKYLAPTGRLVYVGITAQELSFPHMAMHKPEATLLASRNALPGDFPRIIADIESGKINTDPWITRRLAMDDVAEQFDSVATPAVGAIKTMIEVG